MIDLAALRDLLVSRGSPLALSADDTALPTELRSLLGTVPGRRLTVRPGADGIRLDGQTLTVAGACAGTWPVQGMAGVTVSLESATVTVVNAAGASTVAATAAGAMPVAGRATGIALASAIVAQTPGWTLTLAGPTAGLRASDLLAVAGVAGPQAPAVDVLGTAVTVDPAGFVITFFPGTAYRPWFTAALSAPDARWTVIDGVLDLTGLDVDLFLTPDGYRVVVTGHVTVDGLALDLNIGLGSGPRTTIEVRPSHGTAFPGIAALADWLVAGPTPGGQVTSAFQSVGFDPAGFDLAISAVRVGFDSSRRSLTSVEIASLLTIRALELDVSLRLPDLTVTGQLHGGPLGLAAVLSSFGLDIPGVPQNMTLSAAAFGATPGLGLYSASLELDDVWPVGPLDLTEVLVQVARDPLNGFTGAVSGRLLIGDSIVLSIATEYDGTGWTFLGTTGAADGLDVGDLIAELASSFGISAVPPALRSLQLTEVSLVYATGTKVFTLTATGTVVLADTPVVLAVDVTLGPATGSSWPVRFDGRLTVAGLEFAVTFDERDGTELLAGTYHHDGAAATISLHDLVAALSPSAAVAVPAELSIGLTDVVLLYTGSPSRTFAVGLDLAASVDLSKLPLVGDQLPPDATLRVIDLQLLYSRAAVDAATVEKVNALLAPGVTGFPGTGLAAGAALTAQLAIGADQQAISLGVPAAAPPPAIPPPTNALPAAAIGAGAPAAGGTGAWFPVQRTVGVVTVNRVGLLYQHNALLLALDADIRLGPLGFSLNGLAIGSTLTAFSPVFSLDGLGLGYTEGPLEITGALLRTPDSALPPGVTLQFDGSALVKAETFGLAAVGSWAQLAGGQPSLFVFAEYDEPLGGPPALFVTGLMAGFGYNRSLALPAQNEVASFPLLLLNQPPAGGQPPAADAVLAILEGQHPATPGGTTRQWIAPAPGSDWLAVGVVFTSFELVHSRALLVAQFGAELVFALLGTSTLQLPVPDEPGPTYAYAELDLAAVLKPDEGFFGLTAVLAPTSYVLTQACHLTGGFAMSVWFGDNPQAGQFVLTLGGYHPAFAPPPYYPSVPRLGFTWAVSDTVTVSGSAYLAVTPSCAMAGGGLDVEFHDGDLRAWFTANADVLLSWRPFFFTADIDVSIGVSYRLNLLFCYKTISISLGAGVRLWGPPTGGQVHVELWIISFTVAFGAGQPDTADKKLAWPEFSALLPSSAVTLVATGGLMSTMDSTVSSSGKAWLVRARDFGFATQSALPASHLRYGDTPATAPPDQSNFDGAAVDVRPMNLTGVAGVHRLTLYRGTTAAPATGWAMRPRAASLPQSLWGKPPSPFTQIPAAPSAAVLPGQYVGYDVGAAPPTAGATRGVFPIAELAQTELPPGGLPLVPAPRPDPRYTPAADATSVELIAAIADAAPARTAVYQALSGVFTGTDGPLTQLAAHVQRLFADAPMVEGAAR